MHTYSNAFQIQCAEALGIPIRGNKVDNSMTVLQSQTIHPTIQMCTSHDTFHHHL